MADSVAKIAIIGIGNILFMDEGLGVYAAQFLRQNYRFSPEVDIVDGGTLGMDLIGYYQSYEHVIVLDTISVDATSEHFIEPGAVYSLNAEQLKGLGAYRKTAHEIEVLQTLELAALSGETAQIQVIAMVPEDMQSVAINLTQTIEKTMPLMVQTVIDYLQELAIEVAINTQMVALKQVVYQYQLQDPPS